MNIEKVIIEAFKTLDDEFTGFEFTNVLREFHLTEDQIRKHRRKFLKYHAKTISYKSKTWKKNSPKFPKEPKPFRVPTDDLITSADEIYKIDQQEEPQAGFCLFSRAGCTLPKCDCAEFDQMQKDRIEDQKTVDKKLCPIHCDPSDLTEAPSCLPHSQYIINSVEMDRGEQAFTLSDLQIITKRDKGTDLACMIINNCIEILKKEGYKIMKPIQEWKEI